MASIEDDLKLLDSYLALRDSFDSEKEQRMQQIKLSDIPAYDKYACLMEEYASYEYDSALLYVGKLIDEAQLSQDLDKIAQAQIRKSFVYLSAGLFKESADLLSLINPQPLDTATKIAYYNIYARLMYDLADYNRSELYHQYILQGNLLTDTALMLLSPRDTSKYWYAEAVRDMKTENLARALERFRLQLQASDITEHEKAITYSSMGYIYHAMGDSQQSLHYNILAVISDIRHSTKEAVALRNVALQVFRQKDTKRAAEYITFAMQDAQFYNARHRQVEISQILPIIEQAQLEQLEAQNVRIRTLSILTYGLLIVLFGALIMLYNRVRALGKAHKTIEQTSMRLKEANRIKDGYISMFLSRQRESMTMMQQYQHWVRKRAQDKRLSELLTVPQQFNPARERKEFYKQFDDMLLGIFPNFVEQFNQLLKEGEQLEIKKGEKLNAELRIFAMIRLGVTDNEQIAQVLDYSVNTIYTYKTRIRNRSDLTSAEFYQRLMEIDAL